MSERYTQVFALPQNLYAKDMPVIIENGRLLKDNTTGGVIAQFKILNISKPLIALKIGIRLRGVSNEDFGEIEYEYLDLKIKRDDTFGIQTPIKLENDKVRSIEPYIKRVVFADNSTVEFDYAELKPLPESKGIETVFDREKTALYKKFFCASASVMPCKYEDIWVCACGCVNNADEEKCHSCGFETAKAFMPIDEIITTVDYNNALELSQKEDKTSLINVIAIFEQLNGYKDSAEQIKKCQELIVKIKEQEEADRIEAQRKAEEKRIADEKAAKKRKKIIISSSALIAVIVLLSVILKVSSNSRHYAKAEKLLSQGKNIAAVGEYIKSGNYKDSKEKRTELLYEIRDTHTIGVNLGGYAAIKSDGTLLSTEFPEENYKNVASVFAEVDLFVVDSNNSLHILCDDIHRVPILIDDSQFPQKLFETNWTISCNWSDIKSVKSSYEYIVGLRNDGTMVSDGYPGFLVTDGVFNGTIDFAIGGDWIVYLKEDGKAISTLFSQKVYAWNDIVSVVADYDYVIGLSSDGKVNFEGSDDYSGTAAVLQTWSDIVSVKADGDLIAGLKSDGTVVYIDESGKSVSMWENIIEIAVYGNEIIGLKDDGTLASLTGSSLIENWTDIRTK